MVPYHPLEELLARIDDPHGRACERILADYRALFQSCAGSTHNHQAWPGGYIDHVCEIMNIAVVLYGALNSARPLPFSLSDALLILFLHDIEKPWKYEMSPSGERVEIPNMRDKEAQIQFRFRFIKNRGIELNEEQANAMRYVEGESKDYSGKRRVANPLAAFCHLCDTTSARIWFDHPLESEDPWRGASRVRLPT